AAIDELAKATNESVTNLGNAVSGLDEDLAGTQDAVAENRKDIDANTVAIDKLKETQTYKDLSKVETLVKDKADKTAVEKNASRITDTRNKQVLQNARLDNHGERIEANKAAIGDLATVIDEAVTNLDGVVNDLHGDLSVTKHTVAENRKDIDKNASRITNTRNKQVLQNARLDNHSNRIATNKSDIATNKADITTNKADITTNKADIATNKADIATNKADIADSKANIITNRANITANTAAIATHNQRLDHLDNRVNKLDKDLKRGLATQAALTGLFQPYTVGKANVTAAVGGYKSQTAVAIGTGYRYNKHVATKAGVAFTQGGAAYNVGVNFEW
ncbi:YadA-like family protein, partial [Haemophilus paraphrohaemolyticus]|uniref:YadA-like family protein n=1 Tax=Haemophilus paraphrohaemolyticus TaxID=736 RepID=UPI0023F1B450